MGYSKMQSVLPTNINHCIDNILIGQNASPWDLPWWMLILNGKFIVSSAYHLVRHGKEVEV